MSNDRQVINSLSPADLVELMNATGIIAVHESSMSDGKPVIHAAVKVVNAQTGEQLPGGLPFSVVMFKAQGEPGYSNIAIGTIVPASELRVALPRDYFNFCNQRFRFTRVFPVDERSFVIQMDLVLKNATREYVKFSLGLWGALFSQLLFELMGRRRESLIDAAEAYAEVHTDFAEQIVASPEVADAAPLAAEPEAVMSLDADTIVAVDATMEVAEVPAETPLEAPSETPAENAMLEEAPIEAAAVEAVAKSDELGAAELDAPKPAEPIVEAPEPVAVVVAVGEAAEPELSIVAGPAAVETVEADEIVAEAAELADVKIAGELGNAEAKDVMPA